MKGNRKMYESPRMEVIKLSTEDILTESDGKGENARPDDEL